MRLVSALSVAILATVLAGCASGPPPTPGKTLVYKDASGKIIRVFDYPNEAFCARVEQAAGGARCQPQSASAGMGAQATLRYHPPGELVQAWYADMARCQTETRQLGAGVEVVKACTAM